MKNFFLILIMAGLSLPLSSCLKLDKKEKDKSMYCLMYVSNNAITLHFNSTALIGKQYKIKSNGQLVYDTCQGGIISLNDGRQFLTSIDGADGIIQEYMIKSNPLPTGESLELSTQNQCSDPETSLGIATINYIFLRHNEDAECNHDYYWNDQSIVFQ